MTAKTTLTVDTADPGIVQGTPTHHASKPIEYFSAGSAADKQAKRDSIHKVLQDNPLLSPSEYKELLDTEGLLSPQEVVFHIIPRHLGGANHVDNMIHASKTVYQRARPYKEGKSSSPVSLNWAGTWDDEWDGIAWVAFQIGITHMDRAITISQSLGNTKTGKKYLGPDASDFYSRGQELNRLLRRRQQRSGGLDRPLGKDEDKLKVSPTSPNPPPISPGSAGTKAPVAENPFADPTQLSVSGSFASTGSSSSSAPLEKPRRKSFVERLFGKH